MYFFVSPSLLTPFSWNIFFILVLISSIWSLFRLNWFLNLCFAFSYSFNGSWWMIGCGVDIQLFAFTWVLRSRIFVDLNLSPLYRGTSKNISLVSLISWVNLIVGWIWLIVDMNFQNQRFRSLWWRCHLWISYMCGWILVLGLLYFQLTHK